MNRRSFLGSLGAAALGGCAGALDRTDQPAHFAATPPDKPIDLDRWHDALATARLHEIGWLREYRERGVFPRNHRVLGRTPTFIDEAGRACAVGYLMQRSGYRDLASTIARTDNHVYVEHIERGPALDWILFSGLTQDECATIQPSYGFMQRPHDPTERERETLRTHFANVEAQLLRDTKSSLHTALALLEPRIEAGASIDRVIHRTQG